MATKIYTPEEIDNINLGRKAVKGVEYKDTRGYTFVWVEENKLRLKDSAANISFTPSTASDELSSATDVQGAIVGIQTGVNKSFYRIPISFGDNGLNPEMIYVTIQDKYIKSSSVISASVSIDTALRGADELEFTNFICSAVNIIEGVSYQILVTDQNRAAEGRYVLNVIKK